MKQLVVIGLQHSFLQMVYEQIQGLTKSRIDIKVISLNDMGENPLPLEKSTTVLYFSKGLRTVFEKISPEPYHYIHARREGFIYNMGDLFSLKGRKCILVVNDIKTNTDEMTTDLKDLDLGHEFIPYYPDQPVAESIDFIVTAGEQPLVPSTLSSIPVIDIGSRVISLNTVFTLFDYFKIPGTHAKIARHYMQTMVMLSKRWQRLSKGKLEHPDCSYRGRDRSGSAIVDPLIQKSAAMDLKSFSSITRDINTHGFIGECQGILSIYKAGKQQNIAYGRTMVQEKLAQKGFALSQQQLRLKLERMNNHGLLIVRPGRGGTTISEKGEQYLLWLQEE